MYLKKYQLSMLLFNHLTSLEIKEIYKMNSYKLYFNISAVKYHSV